MLELGKSVKKEHYEIGRQIKKLGFENLYTLGDESYNTLLGAKGVLNNYYFNDKSVLSEFLKLNAAKNDLIFIKGSHSMKMDEIVEYLKKNINR